MASDLMPDVARRMASHREIDSNGCWNWTAYVSTSGYGMMSIDNRQQLTHRLAWVVEHGPIPDGLWVLHHCDNRRCFNPAHLFLGTHEDNMADMTAKGRSTVGTRNGMARLTEADVLRIRELFAHGRTNEREMARNWGVSQAAISMLLSGVTWRHVGGPLFDGRQSAKTHCNRGHLFDEENTGSRPCDNARLCLACRRINAQASQERRRAIRDRRAAEEEK